jgi:hypothetical protein
VLSHLCKLTGLSVSEQLLAIQFTTGPSQVKGVLQFSFRAFEFSSPATDNHGEKMPLTIRRPTEASNTQPSLCCGMATVFNRNSRSPQRNLKRQQPCSDENTSQHDQPRKPASRDHSASPARLRLLLFFGTCCAHELRLRRLSELIAPRIDKASRMNREAIIYKP